MEGRSRRGQGTIPESLTKGTAIRLTRLHPLASSGLGYRTEKGETREREKAWEMASITSSHRRCIVYSVDHKMPATMSLRYWGQITRSRIMKCTVPHPR